MNRHNPYSPPPGAGHLIAIELRQLNHLFNALDPSPFLERDLDERVESYIVDSADEFPLSAPLTLIFYISPGMYEEATAILPSAIHNYFDYREREQGKRLRALWRQGRISLVIALSFLLACLSLSKLIGQLGEGTLIEFLQEGLLIVGWVALWRPLEILLYDWWPVKRERKIFEKLSRIPVEIRSINSD